MNVIRASLKRGQLGFGRCGSWLVYVLACLWLLSGVALAASYDDVDQDGNGSVDEIGDTPSLSDGRPDPRVCQHDFYADDGYTYVIRNIQGGAGDPDGDGLYESYQTACAAAQAKATEISGSVNCGISYPTGRFGYYFTNGNIWSKHRAYKLIGQTYYLYYAWAPTSGYDLPDTETDPWPLEGEEPEPYVPTEECKVFIEEWIQCKNPDGTYCDRITYMIEDINPDNNFPYYKKGVHEDTCQENAVCTAVVMSSGAAWVPCSQFFDKIGYVPQPGDDLGQPIVPGSDEDTDDGAKDDYGIQTMAGWLMKKIDPLEYVDEVGQSSTETGDTDAERLDGIVDNTKKITDNQGNTNKLLQEIANRVGDLANAQMKQAGEIGDKVQEGVKNGIDEANEGLVTDAEGDSEYGSLANPEQYQKSDEDINTKVGSIYDENGALDNYVDAVTGNAEIQSFFNNTSVQISASSDKFTFDSLPWGAGSVQVDFGIFQTYIALIGNILLALVTIRETLYIFRG